ncbi:copper resistance CopC family protein [Methylocystis echinoides]|jgi:methionine-rich copper-binding protein CopC|uniref:copper resistance CopC family protein n=1 Tax=Methylocystis echinoides TaxID=29468 RepID=UPI00342EB5F8
MTWRLLTLSTVLFMHATSSAVAHASLIQASPQPGAVVAGDRVSIELRFDSRLDARFSGLKLLRADDNQAALTMESANSPSVLRASGTGLTEGRYVLYWRVLSVDGHANQGEIKFEVRP